MIDLLQTRRSIRKFQDRPVEEEKIAQLMKAALMSPSSKSSRPWHFIVVDDKEKLQKISESREMGSQFVSGAPLAVLVLAEEKKSNVWVEDCSIAALLIQLEAHDLGLGSCWVQVRNRMKDETVSTENFLAELLGVPEGMKMECIIAVGYKDEEKRPFDESRLLLERVHRNQF